MKQHHIVYVAWRKARPLTFFFCPLHTHIQADVSWKSSDKRLTRVYLPKLPVFILPPLLPVASSILTWRKPDLISLCAADIPEIPQPIITICMVSVFMIDLRQFPSVPIRLLSSHLAEWTSPSLVCSGQDHVSCTRQLPVRIFRIKTFAFVSSTSRYFSSKQIHRKHTSLFL